MARERDARIQYVTEDIHRSMARGVMWMSLARIVVRGLGLASTVVLARLLGPDDFGLIAMATAVVAFAELVRAFSFDAALIQERNASPDEFNTAWTLNALLGCGIGVLLAVAAPFIAGLYGDPRITGVLMVLSLSFLLDGLQNVGTIEFRRQMNFRMDFLLMVTQKAAAFVTTLTLAFWLRNYWALAFGILASTAFGVLLSYLMHPFRPRFSLVAHRKLVSFSQWMLLSNFAGFLKNKTSDILLGKLQGPHVVGLFSVAYDVANLATTELVAPINRAVLPGYVKLAEDPAALRQGFARVLAFIALVACPAACGIAALSSEVVLLALGPKWTDAATLVQILAIGSAMHAMLTNSVPVFIAAGRPKIVALMAGIHTGALVPMLAVGILWYGALGAAYAHLAHVALIAMPTTYYMLVRFTPVVWRDIAVSIWRPILGAALMYFVVRQFCAAWVSIAPAMLLIEVITAVGVGASVYIASVLVLWLLAGCPPGAERITLDFTRKLIQKRFSKVFA
jgi:lipopolysaccharide exporter